MGIWNWFHKRRKTESRGPLTKPRRLFVEFLEPRQLLSGTTLSATLAADLALLTPNPHPSGDQPADASQLVPLAN